MRTSYIPNTPLYRAAVTEDTLYVFNDREDKLVLSISPITASNEELEARGFDSLEEFQSVEIQRIIEDEILFPLDCHSKKTAYFLESYLKTLK